MVISVIRDVVIQCTLIHPCEICGNLREDVMALVRLLMSSKQLSARLNNSFRGSFGWIYKTCMDSTLMIRTRMNSYKLQCSPTPIHMVCLSIVKGHTCVVTDSTALTTLRISASCITCSLVMDPSTEMPHWAKLSIYKQLTNNNIPALFRRSIFYVCLW